MTPTEKRLKSVIGVTVVLAVIVDVINANADYEERVTRASVFPSQQTMDGWASDLDLTFKRLTNGETDITGASQFQFKYQNSLNEDEAFEIAHAEGEKILLEMTNKISKIFDKNIAALKNLQEAAEGLIEAYPYNENLLLKDVPYVNLNRMTNLSEDMVYSQHFKQDIYEKSSGVQIPIEIYEGYPDVLNGINWSADLDDVFKKNRQEYPGIYWQSFASRNGYLRVYPAAKWPVIDGLPDLFDVRRRPWYIHGTSSPKDVVILLDTSGSMHGQSFDIMKLAAKTLLNTLGENDFVNVARFAKNVTWVTPCLTTLVQANARNKRLLFDGIDTLVDHHVASYSRALEFAYTAFEDFEGTRSPNEGSDCHKLIMVFSDGGTEYPSKIIKVFSNRSITKQVRIFSYAVGPHPLPTVALKKMACDTGGAFTTITSMGAIRTKIQDYARVLSKPLVLNEPEDFLQTTLIKDHLDNQTLAGVIGVDIPVFTFRSLTPRSKLGPFGYSFGLNANGFLIWHPDLWTVANYLEDPAHNDLADIEGETDDLAQLRQEMVDFAHNRGEGHALKDLQVALTMQDGHALQIGKEYHFGSVRGTSFSVGVVVPKTWDYIRVPVQGNIEAELRSLNRGESVLAPWKICDETKDNPDLEVDTLDGIIKQVQSAKCHGEDLNHLIWDIKNTRDVFESLKPVGLDPDHLSRFVITDGGLTMFKPQNKIADFEWLNADPYNSTLYKFVVASPTPVIFVQTYVKKEVIPLYHVVQTSADDLPLFDAASDDVIGDNNDSDYFNKNVEAEEEKTEEPIPSELTVSDKKPGATKSKDKDKQKQQPTIVMRSPKETTLHLAKAFRVSKAGKNYTAGVSGIRIPDSYLQQLLLDHSPSPRGELSCANSTDIRCYFVDFSGYILASNQPRADVSAGDFLGRVDDQIMEHLVKFGFFHEKAEFNYQGLCPSPVECTAASSSIVRSIFGSALNGIFVALKSFIALVNQVNYGILSFLAALYIPVEEVEAVSEYGYRIAEGLHRCTTKTSNWYLNESSPVLYRDRISSVCDKIECNRTFHLYRMKNINGLLIVADNKCSYCKGKSYFDGPVEVDLSDTCLLPKRYRRRPDECFASHEGEIMECSSANVASTTFGVVFSVALASYLAAY